jgi:hypothetical protein
MKPGLQTALLALVVGVLLWVVLSRRPETDVLAVHGNTPANAPALPAETNNLAATPETVAPSELPESSNAQPGSVSRTASLETASQPEGVPGPAIVLENLRSVFRDYSARFGGNPVGTNPEITARLNGGNPGHVVFLKPEDGMRLNGRGELVDNWGTPYFFHQLSRTEMEIHSAGPDRKMWTSDDLVIK